MKTKSLWLIGGLFMLSGLPPTVDAAGLCLPARAGCGMGNADTAARAFAAASGTTAESEASDDDRHSLRIAPIGSSPGGQTYGRWAVEWWQWAVSIPEAVNPVLDATGQHCAQRQVGKVWFLANGFGPSTIARSCTIPAGKSLFFPLINTAYFAFLNDAPETRTEEFVRDAGSCTEPAQISVWIDGFEVPRAARFFTGASGSQSPIFNAQLPPGNVLRLDETVIPELGLSPGAEQGYYLFVRPLRPGPHTIRSIASGCTLNNSQDITYHLTVAGS